MDPVTALGVAAAVAQFVGMGIKVAKTISEYVQASEGDVPRSLENISTQLPLILNALSQMKDEKQIARYDVETRYILHGVIVGCLKLVKELDEIAAKIQPKSGEKLSTKLKKVLINLKKEDRVVDIDKGLHAYVQVLILHQVVDRSQVVVSAPEETEYFEVKEQRIATFHSRDALLARIDSAFSDVSHSQKDSPEFVILQSERDSGKTQLALAYCHGAYDRRAFRTVFWLDASTPETLKRSMESAASGIRRSKQGSRTEKLAFLDNFLTERWQPWLLVLDNYHHSSFEKEPVRLLLPRAGHGAILVTTRDREASTLGNTFEVYKYMTTSEKNSWRHEMTVALHKKDLDFVKTALSHDFDVNSYTKTIWQDEKSPIVNVAAEIGFDEAMRLLLERGANPSIDKMQGCALQRAASKGLASTVNTYLDWEDQSGKVLDKRDYEWVFRCAIGNGDVSVLKILLHRRQGVFNPESEMAGEGFERAAEEGKEEMLRYLFSQGSLRPHARRMVTLLTFAIKNQHLALVKFFISEVKVDLDSQDFSGETPLCVAVDQRHRRSGADTQNIALSLLLEAGASPDVTRISSRQTPLHLAAYSGQVAAIKLLIENGADVTKENEDGNTPLLWAIDCKTPASYPPLLDVDIADPQVRKSYFTRPLFTAARLANRELALPLLKKADINAIETSSGDTPLLAAIRNKHVAMARMLIRNGAKQDVPDKEGKLPLAQAAERGLHLVINDLAKAKDFPGLEIVDKAENTPLMLAVKWKHDEAVAALLKLGADKEAMNQFGETALDIAEEKNMETIIQTLSTSVSL